MDNKLGNKVLHEHMKQPWMQLKMFSQLTQYFHDIQLLQKLKLKRADCYSSAAMPWKVGVTRGANIQSDSSSPLTKWVGSVWTVCLKLCFFSSSLIIPPLSFVLLSFMSTCLNQMILKRHYGFSGFTLTSIYSFSWTSSQLIWLL